VSLAPAIETSITGIPSAASCGPGLCSQHCGAPPTAFRICGLATGVSIPDDAVGYFHTSDTIKQREKFRLIDDRRRHESVGEVSADVRQHVGQACLQAQGS